MADDFPLTFGDAGLLRGRVENEDERTLVLLAGELDMASADHLDALLEELQEIGPVLLDLRGLEFLDSTGAAALVAAHRRAPDTHVVTVRSGSGAAHRTLAMMGLVDVLAAADAPEGPGE